jgi:hypothetical protein
MELCTEVIRSNSVRTDSYCLRFQMLQINIITTIILKHYVNTVSAHINLLDITTNIRTDAKFLSAEL